MPSLNHVLHHRARKKSYPIVGEVVVGRDGADIEFFDDEKLSRRHCKIFVDSSGRLYVEDLNATNKTWVNEKPLIESASCELHLGDVLRVGNQVFDVTQDQALKRASAEATMMMKSGVPTERVNLGLARGKRLVLWLMILVVIGLLSAFVFYPEEAQELIQRFL